MRTLSKLALAALSLILASLGCSKSHSSALTPLSEAEIKPVIQESFAGAPSTAKADADQFVQSMQSHDFPAALDELQRLRMSHGLTPDQQTALARATITTTRNLQAAADAGDQKAAAILHEYKMNH